MAVLLLVLGPRDQLYGDIAARLVEVDDARPRDPLRFRGLDHGWLAERRRGARTEQLELRRITEETQVTPDERALMAATYEAVEVHLANGRAWFLAWLANQPTEVGQRNRMHDAWPTVEAEVDAGRWTWHTPASAKRGRARG